MKNSNLMLNKKLSVVVLAIFMWSISSWVNANSIIKDSEGVNLPEKTEKAEVKSGISANPTADLEKAKKEGKVVFLVITGTGAKDLNKTINMANEAKGKVSKSLVVQMNKDDASNASLVSKLGIAGVPVPFIVVISSKGVPVAGFSHLQATSALLVKSVPSPKQDEAFLALSEKKPVFIIVSKKGLSDKASVLSNCKSACAKITSKPVIIEIDYNDAKEKTFISQIGVASVTDKTVVVVINVSGQITETMTGTPDINKLVLAANKVIKSGGCCPGGKSSNGCAPKK